VRYAWLLTIGLMACGSRTTLDDLRAPIDASVPVESAAPVSSTTPPHVPHPPGYICFGDVTLKNVTCDQSRGAVGSSCDATLLCNGEHVLQMRCENGQCVCDNPGFDTCYCDAPKGLDDPCGAGNCCWK
jgi:hypothetical protein